VRRLSLVLVFVLALLTLAAPGATAATKSKGAKVDVKLYEFGVRRKPAFVAAAKVTFRAKNIGVEKHELVVVRVEPGAKLPTKADGSVDEEAIPEADKMGEVANVKPKKVKTLRTTLDPARYVLFCNIVDTEKDGTVVSHYAKGMHRSFTAG